MISINSPHDEPFTDILGRNEFSEKIFSYFFCKSHAFLINVYTMHSKSKKWREIMFSFIESRVSLFLISVWFISFVVNVLVFIVNVSRFSFVRWTCTIYCFASSSNVTLLVSLVAADDFLGKEEALIFSRIGPRSAPSLISSNKLDAKFGSKFRRSR